MFTVQFSANSFKLLTLFQDIKYLFIAVKLKLMILFYSWCKVISDDFQVSCRDITNSNVQHLYHTSFFILSCSSAPFSTKDVGWEKMSLHYINPLLWHYWAGSQGIANECVNDSIDDVVTITPFVLVWERKLQRI